MQRTNLWSAAARAAESAYRADADGTVQPTVNSDRAHRMAAIAAALATDMSARKGVEGQ